MNHWASIYVGEPWESPDNDCWGFFRKVQRDRFGVDVPIIAVNADSALTCRRTFAGHEERGNWELVESPREGDAVLMGKNSRPSHVGVWVDTDGGAVLHCVDGIGVICQGLRSLGTGGWRVLGYFRKVQP